MQYKFTIIFKQVTMFYLVVFIILSLVACKTNKNDADSDYSVSDPFKIVIVNAELIKSSAQQHDELNRESGIDETGPEIDSERLRLNLTISINNKINDTFDNVQYKIILNESAEPFIASGVLEKNQMIFSE